MAIPIAIAITFLRIIHILMLMLIVMLIPTAKSYTTLLDLYSLYLLPF